MKNLNELNEKELERLKRDIDFELDKRADAEWRATTKTVPELVKIFEGSGYSIPSNSKFWRIQSGDYRGCYGYQVGQYTHSCHIDTTDFIVLFVNVYEHDFSVDSYSERHLDGPMIVI